MSGHSRNRAWRPARGISCILLLLTLAPFAADAQVPDVPNVPDHIPSTARESLLVKRDEFATQRSAFIEEATAHNAQCKQVALNTPKADSCEAARNRLIAELAKLQSTADALNAELRGAAANETARKAATSYMVMPASVRGEVYAVSADGHKTPIDEHRVLTIDTLTTIITGATGRVQFLLPDETVFTIGPNGTLTMDSFVFDPKTSSSVFIANIAKGVFRWVTVEGAPHKLDMRLKVAVGTIGPRGTDFELMVSDDGSGFVKLFSGELVITPADGSPLAIIKGGQQVRFTHDKLALPEPIPASG
jgi:FecR-like protein